MSSTSAAAQASYIDEPTTSPASRSTRRNPLTVDFTLTKPATYFPGMLSLPPFNPAPVEILQLPARQHRPGSTLISDGPYKVQSYVPDKSIVFVRNPAWKQSSRPDPQGLRRPDRVSETGNQQAIYQQILTNTPQADMQWDVAVPPNDIPGLIASKNPGLPAADRGRRPTPTSSSTPSRRTTTGRSARCRSARPSPMPSTGPSWSRTPAVPTVAPPLTHLIAPGTDGSSPNFDDYPYNPTKAKQMLAAGRLPAT